MKWVQRFLLVTGYGLLASWVRAEIPIQAWAQRHGETQPNRVMGKRIATDSVGNVVVAGYAQNDAGQQIVVIKYSETGATLWTNRHRGPAETNTAKIDLAVSPAGNVYVAGAAAGAANDYVTLAYAADGTPLWTNRYNAPLGHEDKPSGLALDPDGNVVVTGHSWANAYGPDFLTIKYSPAGIALWTNRFAVALFPMNPYGVANAVATDLAGNVFVTGYAWLPSGGYGYVTVKYDGLGTQLWSRYYHTDTGSAFAQDLVVNPDGSAIVTGYAPGISTSVFTTVKYSASGTALWTNKSSGGTSPQAIATDETGNIFVAGFRGSWQNGVADFYTVSYSSSGALRWAQSYNGPAKSNDLAYALALDASGSVLVTGSSQGGGSGLDIVTIKYSNTGTALWTNRINGSASGNDEAFAIAIGPSGGVYLAGTSEQSPSPPQLNADLLTVKYSVVVPIRPQPMLSPAGFGLSFTNLPGGNFSVWTGTNIALPEPEWIRIGDAVEITSGQYQFMDSEPPTHPQRFYQVTAP
jgi:uncharacterized delta-60 repeat protein